MQPTPEKRCALFEPFEKIQAKLRECTRCTKNKVAIGSLSQTSRNNPLTLKKFFEMGNKKRERASEYAGMAYIKSDKSEVHSDACRPAL